MENNTFKLTQRGRECVIHEGFVYTFDRSNVDGDIRFWRCNAKNVNCKSRLHTRDGQVIKMMNSHNHEIIPIGCRMRKKLKKKGGAEEGMAQSVKQECCVIDPLFAQDDTNQTTQTSYESSQMTTKTKEETPVTSNHERTAPPRPQSTTVAEDEFDIVGKNVAAKLRQLPPTQRIFAERLINEVLFEAQLGTLTRESGVVLNAVMNNRGVQVSYESQQLTTSVDLKPFL